MKQIEERQLVLQNVQESSVRNRKAIGFIYFRVIQKNVFLYDSDYCVLFHPSVNGKSV